MNYDENNTDLILLTNNSYDPHGAEQFGGPNTFFRACLVLILRIGFILVQIGCVPVENIYIIIMQNIFNISTAILSYLICGYIISFGKYSYHGFIGYGSWIESENINLDNAIYGMASCIIGAAVICTLLSGRMHSASLFIINIAYCMFFQPVIIHWVRHNDGWMNKAKLLDTRVQIKDHGGDMFVHLCSSLIGLLGSLFLGRRLIILENIDDLSIGNESGGSVITGYFFIILGLIGYTLPTIEYDHRHIPNDYVSLIVLNNMMAMAAGIFVVTILCKLIHRKIFTYWVIVRCMQGATAAVIVIAAGVDVYSPMISFGIASVASICFFVVSFFLLNNTSLEDPCNITVIHLFCGFLGSFLPPLLGKNENLGSTVDISFRLIHLLWQFICDVAVILFVSLFHTILFLIFKITDILHNRYDKINHTRSLTVQKKLPRMCCASRLFQGEKTTSFIEPGKSRSAVSRQASNKNTLQNVTTSESMSINEKNTNT